MPNAPHYSISLNGEPQGCTSDLDDVKSWLSSDAPMNAHITISKLLVEPADATPLVKKSNTLLIGGVVAVVVIGALMFGAM